MVFNVPPIAGLGNTAGFDLRVEALGGRSPAELDSAAGGLVFAANGDPALASVVTTFAVATPRLVVDLDREKAQALGVSIDAIYTALQTTLGGFYVNDFNRFGRIWQVNVQGEAADRDAPEDVGRVHVRNAEGGMVPLSSIVARSEERRGGEEWGRTCRSR